MGDKLKDRAKELVNKYRIVRGSPFRVAIKIKLNKEEEMRVVEDDLEEEQQPASNLNVKSKKK